MAEERQTMKACPECGAGLYTDDDITWCNKCTYSHANAKHPPRKNQYTRKVNPVQKVGR